MFGIDKPSSIFHVRNAENIRVKPDVCCYVGTFLNLKQVRIVKIRERHTDMKRKIIAKMHCEINLRNTYMNALSHYLQAQHSKAP